MDVDVYIDGQPVPRTSVARQEMNFGQAVLGLAPHNFRIEVLCSEVIPVIEKACDTFVTEMELDDRFEPPGGDPLEDMTLTELRRLGWPRFDVLLSQHPELLTAIIQTWLAMALLDGIFSLRFEELTEPAFLLNSLDKVELVNGKLIAIGRAYSLK